MTQKQAGLRIDLGCGAVKKEGTIGIDIEQLPGVDHVLNIETQPLPFSNGTVIYVHSSHFLEHVADPARIFAEITRVCADNAHLELWTPYGGSNPGFILGHKIFFTEDIYLHMCVWFIDFWRKILGARWILKEFHYVVDPRTLCYLYENNISLDFALRHLRNIAEEFCAYITVLHTTCEVSTPIVRRTFGLGRAADRYELKDDQFSPRLELRVSGSFEGVTPEKIGRAIHRFAKNGEPTS